MSHPQNLGLNDGPAGLLGPKVCAGQEHLADGKQALAARFMACPANMVIEELAWQLKQNAGPIACLAVGIDGSPVPDCL